MSGRCGKTSTGASGSGPSVTAPRAARADACGALLDASIIPRRCWIVGSRWFDGDRIDAKEAPRAPEDRPQEPNGPQEAEAPEVTGPRGRTALVIGSARRPAGEHDIHLVRPLAGRERARWRSLAAPGRGLEPRARA